MASASKTKGNEAFKAGDYVAAIGEYTKAMMADPTDTTIPLNRAAAYLKLNKFQDAERDCGKVLSIDPKNIKALFRRGQARSGNSSYVAAEADIDQVLKLEPANPTAKQELIKIKALIENEQKKAGQKKALREAPIPAAPYRRRVPIEIIEEPDVPPNSAEVKAQEPSEKKRPLIEELPDPAPGATKPSPPIVKSFQQAKEERSARASKTVGGGIFKRDGSNADEVFRAKSVTIMESPSPLVVQANGNSRPPTTKPANSFEFQRRWSSQPTSESRWAILQSIPPDTLPIFFKNSLETPLLVSIYSAMYDISKEHHDQRALLAQYLQHLGNVPRFETLLLFLGAKDKEMVRGLLASVDQPVGWKV